MNAEMKELLLKLAYHLGAWNAKIEIDGPDIKIVNLRNKDFVTLPVCDSDGIFNLIHPA